MLSRVPPRRLAPLPPASLPGLEVHHEAETGRTWQDTFQDQLDVPFPDGVPQFRFLVHYPEERGRDHQDAMLIITANHCVCDGRSLEILCAQLLVRLAEDEGPTASAPPPLHSSAPSSLIAHHDLDAISQPAQTSVRYASATDSFRLDSYSGEGSRMRLLYHRLAQAEVDALRGACRKHGVTVSSALLAALAAALGPLTTAEAKDVMGIQCCVDLRRYFTPETRTAIGNMYSMPTLTVPTRKDGSSTWKDVHNMYEQLLWYLDNKEGLHALKDDPMPNLLMAEKMSGHIVDDNNHGRHFFPGLSNLGTINMSAVRRQEDGSISEVEALSVNEFWFASRHERVGPIVMLCAASIPGQGMFLTLNHSQPTIASATANTLLERIFNLLSHFQNG
mmetsp:Transcript_43744/g.111809  ORF Transcript_43744/g.111809 Transcript_43744/m.111809 type:complete len:391 (+) Transcript_43744:97-1269(+)